MSSDHYARDTNTESLYGFSSAVCAVIDEKDEVRNARDLDRYDLLGEEDASVRADVRRSSCSLRHRREFTTPPWTEGDLVVDNLRTIHTATPFDERYDREMWRTTVAHETGGEAYLGASIG